MNEVTKTRRPRRPAGQRAKPVSSTVDGAFEDGKSEMEALKEEIEEWQSSLESNSMEHLPKYEEVQECFGYLETVTDALDNAEIPEHLSALACNYTQDTRQSAGSRSGRMGNAESALSAALSAAEQWLEDNPELELVSPVEEGGPDDLMPEQTTDEEEQSSREDERQKTEEFRDKLQEALDEMGNIIFPGMY